MKYVGRLEKPVAIVGAIASISSICFQLVLFIQQSTVPIGEVLIRFFSYFTILINIAVCSCFVAGAFVSSSTMLFWKKPDTKTAVAVYIFIVALVYNLVLRALWVPTGLQKLVDEMLHVLMPLLFLIYWWLFASKSSYSWRKVARSLLFPFIYLFWVMLYGLFSNWYPYPFLDAFNHGYFKVGVASAVLLILFSTFSFLFYWGLSKKTR
jgi:hypothetical protein